ncbi:MAG: hypothetical protein ACKVJQ_00180 [Alphaproteobacteria bacterium]|jgi:hypothetical protein
MKNRKTSHAFPFTAFTLTIAALLVFAPMHVMAKDKGNKSGGGSKLFGLDRAMERANPKAQDKLKRNQERKTEKDARKASGKGRGRGKGKNKGRERP